MSHIKKINIVNLTRVNLAKTLEILALKPFIANQIWQWIYSKGKFNFSEMSNVSKLNIRILQDKFVFHNFQIVNPKTSFDGTIKFLVKFEDGNIVESVFIPEETRATLCISSQIGCTLSCKFCHTGTQTLVRNLEPSEIVSQIILAKNLINDWDDNQKKLTNLVFMGMGEPFFNYDNLATAINIICDPQGLNFSKKRITISTSGLVPEILRCSNELKTNLAISLHATNDKLRNEIMGINKKYPLNQLFEACKIYNQQNPDQKITFEYVMLKDINDSQQHAHELIDLIKKYNINCKVNLIPFNQWQGCDYKNSSIDKIKIFQEILKKNKLIATIRKTRGSDVMGACGQLKSESQRPKRKFE